jgi:hypothetical protein
MTKPRYIYLAGVRYLDPCDRQWTAAEIDAACAHLCQTSSGQPNPPPNKWYPLNILGYSKYSITKTGRPKKNKSNRKLKGVVVQKDPYKMRFTLTNDYGEQVDEYACELVAKTFFPPPPPLSKPGSVMVHQHNRVTLTCDDASNLHWECDKKKPNVEPAVVKLSAKTIQLKTTTPIPQINPLASAITLASGGAAAASAFAVDLTAILQRVKQLDDKTVRPKATGHDLPLPFTPWDEDEEEEVRTMENSLRSKHRFHDHDDDDDDHSSSCC